MASNYLDLQREVTLHGTQNLFTNLQRGLRAKRAPILKLTP